MYQILTICFCVARHKGHRWFNIARYHTTQIVEIDLATPHSSTQESSVLIAMQTNTEISMAEIVARVNRWYQHRSISTLRSEPCFCNFVFSSAHPWAEVLESKLHELHLPHHVYARVLRFACVEVVATARLQRYLKYKAAVLPYQQPWVIVTIIDAVYNN